MEAAELTAAPVPVWICMRGAQAIRFGGVARLRWFKGPETNGQRYSEYARVQKEKHALHACYMSVYITLPKK